MEGTGGSIRTEQRPALFMTRADPKPGWDGCIAANHQPNREPRSPPDEAYCLGMYVKPEFLGTDAYYYTMTRPPTPYNGMLGEATIQVDSPTKNVNNGDTLNYETFLVVGNKQRVADTFRQLHQAS